MNPQQQQHLKETVQRLSQLPYVNAIILFGSHARGTARQDSDIDIAVLTENATEKQEWEIIEKTDTLDINAFSSLPLIIQFRVLAEGKILYVKNEKVLQKKKANILRKYLAIEPFLEQTARRILAHV